MDQVYYNTVHMPETAPSDHKEVKGTSGGISSQDVGVFLATNVLAYVLAALDQSQEVGNKTIAAKADNLQQTVYTEQATQAEYAKINYQDLTAEEKEALDKAAQDNGQKKMSSSELLKDGWQSFWHHGKAKDGDEGVKLWGHWRDIIEDNVGESIMMGIGLALVPFTVGTSLLLTAGAFTGYSIYNEEKYGTMLNGDKDIPVTLTGGPNSSQEATNTITQNQIANNQIQKQVDNISNILDTLSQIQNIQMTGLTTATQSSSQTTQQIGSILQSILSMTQSITQR